MKKIDIRPQVKSAIFLAFTVTTLASTFTIEFFSSNPKLVELNIESVDSATGDFSGEAVGEGQDDLWEVTGTVVNDKVEMEFVSPRKGKRIVATGKIEKDGMILGQAASEDGEVFEWETTDALVNKVNT